MIKNIIIPENIGSYYLFSKTIVGIDINRTEIHATISIARGYTRTIIQLIEERIENNSLTYEERVINALKSLKTKLGRYDVIYVAFSSAAVIFKEITIPFLGLNKIKMVVPFEVESLLPFTLDQAVIDSIITKEDTKNQRTDVLVAAVKKEHINQFLDLFKAAEMPVEKITIDMFELYGLYKSIPIHAINEPIALIDIGPYTTRLAIVIDGQLKYIRVLSKGLVTIAKKISHETKIDLPESMQQLMRFGVHESDDKNYNAVSNEAINDLVHDLEISIQAYTSKLKQHDQLKKIILTGIGADIPGIHNFIHDTMQVKCEILQMKKILHNGKIESKVSPIPNSFLVSIATAISSPTTEDFNLYQTHVQEEQNKLVNNQIIAIGLIILLSIASFSLYSYFKIRNLRNTYKRAEIEAKTELINKKFRLRNPKDLADANKQANNELRMQETAWQKLSSENRYSLLNNLIELSKCINPKEIELQLTGITIKDETIKLYGSVPGYDQLTKLQNQLKCPAFKSIPKLQEYNFKSDPIILTIKKEGA